VSVNETLFEAKMCPFTLESKHFIFNKCPIYIHDDANAKFNTNSHETDYSVVMRIEKLPEMGKAPCLISCLLARTFQVRQFLREVLVLTHVHNERHKTGKNPKILLSTFLTKLSKEKSCIYKIKSSQEENCRTSEQRIK
jgi:hypothetical protein